MESKSLDAYSINLTHKSILDIQVQFESNVLMNSTTEGELILNGGSIFQFCNTLTVQAEMAIVMLRTM